jgi:uncharacterized RDD family membrane protein YckC
VEAVVNYAGFWLRLVAHLVDWVIVNAALWGLGLLLFVATGDPELVSGAGLLGLVGGTLYWAGMESSAWQATVGKRAAGIKVTDLAGNRVSFLRAFARNAAKLLSSLLFMVGFLMAGFTARKQALHDLLAETLVVRGYGTPPAGSAGPERLSGPAPERPVPR